MPSADPTPRERVHRALCHQPVDRPPFCVWLDGPVLSAFTEREGDGFDPAEHFGADAALHLPWPGWPHGERLEQDGNVWYMPLVQSVAEAEALALPNPGAAEIYAPLDALVERHAGRRAVFVGLLGVLHLADIVISTQNLFMELADNPEGVKRLMERWAGVLEGVAREVCRRDIDAFFIRDDLSSPAGPLMSPARLKEFGVDFDARALAAAREAGVPVGWHSDGDLAPVLGLLADLDLDLDFIGPLSPAYNDQAAFYREYGGRLAVFGGLDNGPIIRSSDPAEIAAAVAAPRDALPAGLLLHTHELPTGTPLGNVDTAAQALAAGSG